MTDLLTIDREGPVLRMGLDRAEKKNALSQAMFRELSATYTELCDDPALRCGVLYSRADLFSSGLDLADMGPALMNQDEPPTLTAEDQVDPFQWLSVAGKVGRPRTKPIVTAIHGACFTGGIELALATDIIVAEEDCTFAQSEILRGLLPLGGAMARFLDRAGWGNTMRWLLTGERFGAEEARRIGFVQEIVPKGRALERAMELARAIAKAAPLGVQGTLINAQLALHDGPMAAAEHLMPYMREVVAPSKDLREGVASLFERREPSFTGS